MRRTVDNTSLVVISSRFSQGIIADYACLDYLNIDLIVAFRLYLLPRTESVMVGITTVSSTNSSLEMRLKGCSFI